ncbi:Lnb N-terminal periplasmic domain-containing protein [Litoribrevibacter albus]|uniref:DUF4105 domain-containing protein n=1 Tax=Litoribrevibacter albus TaxID=1473156 RepID=A0AA37W782_9GAMM|nr:DUF4105 domain-containing protein [Litoribrevibacter albus]GLQ32185.1 hypothetical protein GCM10007876_26640 [Litoribrevibacter albus]
MSSYARANDNQYLVQLKEQAIKAKLSEDSTWRALLHYHEDSFSSSGYSSYVDDADFFYAEDGDTNSEAELLSTLEQVFSTQTQGNDQAQCRFVYRFNWLSEKLSIDSDKLPKATCSDYQMWRKEVNAYSASLVFPASTLNSPSSMFGHTLLRFDPKDIEEGSDWLSYALNFGANVDSGDNSIFFAYRGLAGGYPGVYNMMRYFEKIKEYNRMENRDMWEYKLNLTQKEVDLVLQHVWELKDINFDYFFLDENCSFRLLELLELVRPEVNLTDQFNYAVIPTNTVRVVIDQGMVDEIRFRPSEVSVLRTRIKSLSSESQILARELADDIDVMERPEFQALEDKEKADVIQLAYSFLRYQQRKVQRSKEMAKRSHRLLLALNKLPSEELVVKEPASPETGHETSMLSFGLGERNDDFYQQINFRVNYHDLLDNEQGYLRGAQIMFANTELRYYEDAGLKFNRFDLLDINSISKRNRFLTPLSWRVNVGYERVFSEYDDTGVLQVNAGAGHTYEVTDDIAAYGLLTARLEHNKDFEYFAEPAFGAAFGVLNNTTFGAQKWDINGYKFLNGEYRIKGSFDQNINLSVNHALRFSLGYEWHKQDTFMEAFASYRFYF